MIEKVVLNYLSEELQVPVRMEVPKNPPVSFVVLEKTGSSETNKIKQATMAAQSYGKTMLAAAELNEKVKAAFENMIELPQIGSVSLNSDYNFTNTATEKYRYQAIYVLTYYDE